MFFGGPRKAQRAERVPTQSRRGPTWREILETVARSRDLQPPEEWLSRVVAQCDAAPDREAAIDVAEREFDHFDLGTLDAAIARAVSEVRRLRERRRRLAARTAGLH